MSVDEILLRSRYNPLKRILAYDVFNTGFNGWMTLLPNFTEYPDFDVPPTLVNKDQWPPVFNEMCVQSMEKRIFQGE